MSSIFFFFYFGFLFFASNILATNIAIGHKPSNNNATFTVSLVANGAPGCITLNFASVQACKSFLLTGHYTNCPYTPYLCARLPSLTICGGSLGGNCTIAVPTANSYMPAAGTCIPSGLGQWGTFTVAAAADVNGNAAGQIVFQYASNALCVQAASTIQILSSFDGPCTFTSMCRDGNGDPTNVLVISPLANAGATNNNFDMCQIAEHLVVPFVSFIVDWGHVDCN
jgi:hypothetical protein